jgi:hypothetical protein
MHLVVMHLVVMHLVVMHLNSNASSSNNIQTILNFIEGNYSQTN